MTDILVDRGNSEVACKVTGNQGARLSEPGFVKLIKRAKNDKVLAEAVAIVDVPTNVLIRLAYDDDIAIAAPILERSNVLSTWTCSPTSPGQRACGMSMPSPIVRNWTKRSPTS